MWARDGAHGALAGGGVGGRPAAGPTFPTATQRLCRAEWAQRIAAEEGELASLRFAEGIEACPQLGPGVGIAAVGLSGCVVRGRLRGLGAAGAVGVDAAQGVV
jgi:hypothetical protein